VDVENRWTSESVEALLRDTELPPDSWHRLEESARARCPELRFTADAFAPLRGYPFVPGAANRLRFILDSLNRYKSCFDTQG